MVLSVMIPACSSLHVPKSCANCTTTDSTQPYPVDYGRNAQNEGYYQCSNAVDRQKRVIGDGNCVALIRSCSDAPHTSQWRAGQQVTKTKMEAGTIIATFKNGKYPNTSGWHAAIFIEQDQTGIWVWDQWVGKPVHRRLIRFRETSEHAAAANTAQAYSVVIKQ